MQSIQAKALDRTEPSYKQKKYRWNDALWGYLFIAPSFIILVVFNFYPVLSGLGISLTSWNMLSDPKFIGLGNYSRLVSDPIVPKIVWNTVYYTFLSVPLNIIFSLGLAMALNQRIRGISFFRTAYYLPVVSASVAVSMIWMWILAENGILNFTLNAIGINPISWLGDPKIALTSITLVNVWKNLGFNIIIFLAALQDVPPELKDAAKVDGANSVGIFKHVTLPMISPAILFTTMMGVIGSFQAFDLVYNMTFKHEGGPARSTSVIGFYIWQNAFRYSKMGYAAALAYALFIFIMILTLLQWRARRLWVFGEE